MVSQTMTRITQLLVVPKVKKPRLNIRLKNLLKIRPSKISIFY